MTLTEHDHAMFRYAAQRGTVIVQHEQRARIATLLAWRPNRNGKHTRKARVRFNTGTCASVPLDCISMPEGADA